MKAITRRLSTTDSRATAQRATQPTKSIVNNRPSAIAQRRLQEGIGKQQSQTAQLKKGLSKSPVVQRVVYKGTTYSSAEEKEGFITTAKADLRNLDNTLPEEAFSFLKEIAASPAKFETTEALLRAEQQYLICRNQIDDDVTNTLKILPSKDEPADAPPTALSSLLVKLMDDLGSLPDTGPQVYEGSQVDSTITSILAITNAIAEEKHQINVKKPVGDLETSIKAYMNGAKRTKVALTKISKQQAGIITSLESTKTKLYDQSKTHLVKGFVGYRYSEEPGAADLGLAKLYIGQIEDTVAAKRKNAEKGRGVLFSKPWSLGVNDSFIQGGIVSSKVFKLKTDIPENLVDYLKAGDITGFRAAVVNKDEQSYRPFWHGLRNDFTTFTHEITALVKSGYKLHVFPRKGGKSQQLMALESQKDKLTAYYQPANN